MKKTFQLGELVRITRGPLAGREVYIRGLNGGEGAYGVTILRGDGVFETIYIQEEYLEKVGGCCH